MVALLLNDCSSTIKSASFDREARQHVHHVVIIVQENRSFDNLFHAYPAADTASFGLAHDGRNIRLRPVSLRAPYDIGNGAHDFAISYDGGRMDGWDLRPTTAGRRLHGAYPQFGFVPSNEIGPYLQIAKQYVLADHMFQSNIDQSFAAHLYLVAGQAGRTVDIPNGNPWGCDAAENTAVRTLLDDRSLGAPRFPCFDFRTLGDELDAVGRTWRYYAPHVDSSSTWQRFRQFQRDQRLGPKLPKQDITFPDFGQNWTSYDAVAHVRYGPDWTTNVVAPPKRFISDISMGELAAVTWIVPDYKNSDHSGSQSDTGPSWVSSVVNAVGGSRYWDTTTILIVWDDSGGWYDHVPPPQLDYDGLGVRVPLLVVSPFARKGLVSHRQYEFGTIVKFVESVFGLPPLAASDRRANDLSDCFDFTQSSRRFVPIERTYSDAFFLHQPASNTPPDSD